MDRKEVSKIKNLTETGKVFYYDDGYDIVCHQCLDDYDQRDMLVGIKNLKHRFRSGTAIYTCSICNRHFPISMTESQEGDIYV